MRNSNSLDSNRYDTIRHANIKQKMTELSIPYEKFMNNFMMKITTKRLSFRGKSERRMHVFSYVVMAFCSCDLDPDAMTLTYQLPI